MFLQKITRIILSCNAKNSNSALLGAIAVFAFSGVVVFHALASTSTSFQIENPVITNGGGVSTSSNFRYISTLGQLVTGQSISTSFTQNAGFLYFPTATSPVIIATPGSNQVALTWTSAVGTFANVSGYEVGISTSISGPFSYTDVGTTTSSTRTGLTNGTTYYFKIRSYAAGAILSESVVLSATPVGPLPPSGGGGSGAAPSVTGITFFGRAYPLSKVTILKDGQQSITTIAGPDAQFSATISGLSSGTYTFSVFSSDSNDRQSTLFTFPVTFTSGASTSVGGIFLAPTISVDKSEVKKGDTIAIFGQSAPLAAVTISVHSEVELFRQTLTDANGVYLYNFDTAPLEIGRHQTKSRADVNNNVTQYGKIIGFSVGDKNVPIDTTVADSMRADLNTDGKVNLIDFSIMSYWYRRTGFPEKIDLNTDKKIDLIDFSILAYNWTG
jgi:hypothetical protein